LTINKGRYIPSTAIGVHFSTSFVDSTGNPLEEESLSEFLGFMDAYLGIVVSKEALFNNSYVICSLVTRGGKDFTFGFRGFNVGNTGQLSVVSYRCFIDYDGTGLPS
jgi:hypothetical protein